VSSDLRSILVFSESADVALELLAPARDLANGLECRVVSVALAAGDVTESLARGADRAVSIEGSTNPGSEPAAGAALLCEVVRREHPQAVLVGATVNGAEIAARVAQKLGVACCAECLNLTAEDGKVVAERAWLGGFVARQVIDSVPAIVTIPPGRHEIPPRVENPSDDSETVSVEIPTPRTRVVSTRQRPRSGVRLDRADVIVGAGRGLKSQEDLALLEDLAGILEGAVGATRPVTDDLGWLAVDQKIGLSGQTVKPRLYIACGISGQIEHIVGMRESRVVVAINRDPRALIMDQADYRVVGDLYEIVPALTRLLEEVVGSGARVVSPT
jgi:electron transfer flavoprotein alpha subunit